MNQNQQILIVLMMTNKWWLMQMTNQRKLLKMLNLFFQTNQLSNISRQCIYNIRWFNSNQVKLHNLMLRYSRWNNKILRLHLIISVKFTHHFHWNLFWVDNSIVLHFGIWIRKRWQMLQKKMISQFQVGYMSFPDLKQHKELK